MSLAVVTTGILIARGQSGAGIGITSVSAANPAVVTTSAPHGRATGDIVEIEGSNAVPSLNGKMYTVTNLTATTFSLNGITVTQAGTAAGTIKPVTFSTIGEITSVTPPGFSRNRLESTTHNDGTESY